MRAARRARGWGQRHLARAASLSPSEVGVVERGEPGASLETLDRVAAALDARIVISLLGPPVHDRPAGDPAHARCVSVLRRLLERAGLTCAVEQPVNGSRGIGWIDLLAYDAGIGRLLVIEVKTELRDLGQLLRQVDLYACECLGPARVLGWRPKAVCAIVVALATTEADAFAMANRATLAAAFPGRGRRVVASMLNQGPSPGRGVVLIDPLRPGRRALLPLSIDGRRTEAPYRGYADFMAVSRSRPLPRSARARVDAGAVP